MFGDIKYKTLVTTQNGKPVYEEQIIPVSKYKVRKGVIYVDTDLSTSMNNIMPIHGLKLKIDEKKLGEIKTVGDLPEVVTYMFVSAQDDRADEDRQLMTLDLYAYIGKIEDMCRRVYSELVPPKPSPTDGPPDSHVLWQIKLNKYAKTYGKDGSAQVFLVSAKTERQARALLGQEPDKEMWLSPKFSDVTYLGFTAQMGVPYVVVQI